MSRTSRILLATALVLLAGISTGAGASDRPNILWISTEDMSPNLGAYGDPDAVTPTLDAMAARSVRFTQAQAPAGVCAPARSSIITGVHASSLGSQHMRSLATLPDGIRVLPAYLREHGYHCTNDRKEDYNFETPDEAWDVSAAGADWRSRSPGQPFFSVINFMTTHESRLRFAPERFAKLTRAVGEEQRHDPGTVHVPAWLPDTPEVRREWARYHDMITAMDHQVAEVLARLEEDGLAEDTIIFFFSDHGAGFPRAKQFNYEAGLRVPLLVQVPAKWRHLFPAAEPGTVSDRLVSLVDLAPTVLGLAGVELPAQVQGYDLTREEAPRYLASIRDRMDERIDMSRTLRDGRFKYHRHYLPHVPHFPWLDYMEKLESSQSMRRLAAAGKLSPALAFFMAPTKPVEELYDLAVDPDEQVNLAGDPAHAATLQRMRKAHFDWVLKTRDTGLIPEQMLRDLAGAAGEYAYGQSDAYQLEATLAVARLSERGVEALPQLRTALASDYGPVRFWAATLLVALGQDAEPARVELTAALDDRHAEVAIAAAEALVQLGPDANALALLAHYVGDARDVVRLAAANALDRLDGAARPVEARMAAVAEEDVGAMTPTNIRLMAQWVLQRALFELQTEAPNSDAVDEATIDPLTTVGVAAIDITPRHAVRLHAFPRGERRVPVSAVAQPIQAQAWALGDDTGVGPALLVHAELLGVSEEMRSELAERLVASGDLSEASRLTLLSNHNHNAPALMSVAPFVLRQPPAEEEARQIADYRAWLMNQLEAVVREALADRRPARLAHGLGQGDFAMNRRIIEDGKWVGFGDNPEGPVDHDLPVMTVRGVGGALRAIWFSYAAHGVCWQRPSIHGDWMGVAREALAERHPDAVVIASVGCAGNINPLDKFFRGLDPETPGRAAAAAVETVLAGEMKPLSGVPTITWDHFDLPLEPAPTAEELAEQKGWFAREMRRQLARGEDLAETIPFSAQAWRFGSDLMVFFLSGEVHVQYGLQLKQAAEGERIWVNAYANDAPGYIPAASELPEGGWEVDGSRPNYGIPARFAPELEHLLHSRLAGMIPETFAQGESEEAWWKNTGHPKGKWWLTYEGYEGDAAEKIWETVDIPPSPLLSPEQALESMQLDPRFRIELVAAEPLVVRPVFMRFDERGRLWVVEMPGYMRDIDGTGEDDPTGRVVVLEDADGDGRMDRSTTFLDGLVMPRTLALVPDGALVVEPPRIWLARDLDGDLMADEKVLVAEDYGVTGNPEHSANGLLRGIDNWLYSAKSAVRYRFDGTTLTAEPTAFRGQWGIGKDDTGRLYYNYNASPLHADLAPAEYLVAGGKPNLALGRNVQGRVLLNANLVTDKSLHPARVTPLVTLGASDLRPDGTLKQWTAASSPHIYRGDLFPDDVRGDAFICDPVGNLVAHLAMTGEGLRPRAERTAPDREFLASTDERFRPVFLETGPDGALYLADMYTGIVEHKRYVTEYLRKQILGRNLGNFTETGRIYRIVPWESAGTAAATALPRDPAGWVAKLADDNGWTRDTAQRVLVQGEHVEQAAVLRQMVTAAAVSPLGRLHALWTLEGLGELTTDTVSQALDDEDARVRAAAVRLTEHLPEQAASSLHSAVLARATDESTVVRLQVLLTAGTWSGERAWPMMRAVLAADEAVPEFGLAVAAGLRGRELRFLKNLAKEVEGRELQRAESQLLQQMAFNVMVRGDASEVSVLLAMLHDWSAHERLVSALWQGAAAHRRNGAPLMLSARPSVADAAEDVVAEVLGGVTWPGDPRFAADAVAPLTTEEQERFARGQQTYATICAACHQADGMGMAGVAPPLAGSPWVTGNPRLPVEIILRGLTGPVEVQGRTWDMVMPGLGNVPGMFDDDGLAAVVTYLRRAWGNQATAVSPEDVAHMRQLSANRATPWSAGELQALPEFELNPSRN